MLNSMILMSNKGFTNNVWSFKVLTSQNRYGVTTYGLQEMALYGFEHVTEYSSPDIIFFKQRCSFLGGFNFERILFIDTSITRKISDLPGLEHYDQCYFFELGSMTPFIGAHPVNGEPIVFHCYLDGSLSIHNEKYQDIKYRKAFMQIFFDTNEWFTQQLEVARNWQAFFYIQTIITNAALRVDPPPKDIITLNDNKLSINKIFKNEAQVEKTKNSDETNSKATIEAKDTSTELQSLQAKPTWRDIAMQNLPADIGITNKKAENTRTSIASPKKK